MTDDIPANQRFDLLFLGAGNAFGVEGRAFSSFLLNGRYLFDCGPTVLQQLNKAGVSSNDIDAVLISHFHGDHFFGLPFLLLDARFAGRRRDLAVVGPPGIEQRLDMLLELGYPSVLAKAEFSVRHVELRDGAESEVAGLAFRAVRVSHAEELNCYAYRVKSGGRALVYSGDTSLCHPLLDLASSADVVVMEYDYSEAAVHLSPRDVAEVARHAPAARLIVTHHDGRRDAVLEGLIRDRGLIVAEDLARYSL